MNILTSKEIYYLNRAVELATIAGLNGNHPCGSVIIDKDFNVVCESGNEVFSLPDITAHAEMLCLRRGGIKFLDKSKDMGYTLFSSHEPCAGCSFYIARTSIKKVVYASRDRYRAGLSMLKNNNDYIEYFKGIEVIEEPDTVLRDKAMLIMHNYFISKGRVDNAKYFDPKLLK